MFTSSRYPGAYTKLQQQEDFDDDYDETQSALARHPNAIIVANDEHAVIVPPIPKGSPQLPSVEAAAGESSLIDSHAQDISEGPMSFTARASFSAKRAAELPETTRRYIKSKLPFREKKAMEASFASLPSVIMADIQQGDIPEHADPLMKELPRRGWTIVRRRQFRGRRKLQGKKKRYLGYADLLPFDETMTQADPIYTSVFNKCSTPPTSPTVPTSPVYKYNNNTPSPHAVPKDIPVGSDEYAAIVHSVRTAIESNNIQPTRISQGSSGSYFCRNSQNKIVGVFKPKNEEPYGRLNPKWTKWIHRHLFPCFFGRSCLIPNLGYISEAASSLIDRRLGTCLVPHTNVIHLASPSFHYDYLDRRSASVVGLPPKIGSFQCFLEGFKDANVFLREYPFPNDYHSVTSSRLGSSVWGGCLGQEEDTEDDLEGENTLVEMSHEPRDSRISTPVKRKFAWTRRIQEQFKIEFEQLVILDYLIRNTDRGLDNWMIKYTPDGGGSGSGSTGSGKSTPTNSSNASLPDHLRDYIQIAAIDNGLAFPFKHPDQWRSYPFGWLALPDALVARPFSEHTRRRFLPILSDPLWWRETISCLRELFQVDDDFDERMFHRQMSVLRGQGYNIVRALSNPNASPLDLVSAERVLIIQEEMLIEYDQNLINRRTPQPPVMLPSAASSPSPSTSSARRLRTKRSTSFDLSVHRPQEDGGVGAGMLPWSERVRSRMSLDVGRRRRRRILRTLRLGGARRAGSDVEDQDTSSEDDDEEQQRPVRKRVTIIMETIQPVKSRLPYFTCC